MIDIHCHILPGVDDGADSLETSMMMAAIAADDGVKAIIATPHLLWDGSPIEAHQARIAKSAEKLRTALNQAGIPLSCYVGAEVLYVKSATEPPKPGYFPCIEGTDFVLTEFFFDELPEKMLDYISMSVVGGIKPIIAHPERYYAVQKNKLLLDQFKALGCYLQMNKGSLGGQFGNAAKKVASYMIKNKLADFVATDAHDIKNRTTRLSGAIDLIAKISDIEYAKALTGINQGSILGSDKLNTTV